LSYPYIKAWKCPQFNSRVEAHFTPVKKDYPAQDTCLSPVSDSIGNPFWILVVIAIKSVAKESRWRAFRMSPPKQGVILWRLPGSNVIVFVQAYI
jgi:hypothetical protein